MLGAQNSCCARRTRDERDKEAFLRMQARTVAVAALLLGAWAAPATAQIIATSIPKSISGGAEGRWAFHLMWSPYAKWNINTFQENPTQFLATKGDPKSDFLGAAEVAFKAGSSTTIGIGGWYNKIGNHSADYAFFEVDPSANVFLSGPMNLNITYTEGHANAFYKNLGAKDQESSLPPDWRSLLCVRELGGRVVRIAF